MEPGCLGVQGALACGPQSDSIRKELIRRRKIGESIILDRLKRAKAEGDLPPDADPADLALRSWPQASNAKGATAKQVKAATDVINLKNLQEKKEMIHEHP